MLHLRFVAHRLSPRSLPCDAPVLHYAAESYCLRRERTPDLLFCYSQCSSFHQPRASLLRSRTSDLTNLFAARGTLCACPTVLAQDIANDDGRGVVVLEAAELLYPRIGLFRVETGALSSGMVCWNAHPCKLLILLRTPPLQRDAEPLGFCVPLSIQPPPPRALLDRLPRG
jgi:hypothetical protein